VVKLYFFPSEARNECPPAGLEAMLVCDLDRDHRLGVRRQYRRLRWTSHTPIKARQVIIDILRATKPSQVEYVTWPRHPDRFR